jgi:hypothetical protein
VAKKPEATAEQGKAIKLPSKNTFLAHHKSAESLRTEIAELTGELGALFKDAKKKHLDPWSYKALAALQKLSPDKLAMRLANFDHGRELLGLDEKANLKGRSTPTDGEPAEEGEEDLRPRHLRQPGASAASVVQDLAEGTGAKLPPKDPIDEVGRGKPN